ncbi:MAG: PTS sugar transporter subunit IIA [Anaerolineaceae bacterium]|nr:PTS sugar transporter subunit IIA [Anaerolineaceae bacterium]MDD4043456.1 PTS sugar transporter subunit IIA [Anaerolineaceae bacterium]MDD4578777.1 PTS sugar transporter subunit IIA [Anaerolineaceae bacterium]
MSRILTEELIYLNSKVKTKQEAIQAAGELLVQAGRVEAPYVLGMLARETTMSTMIGNGVAIPHGQFPDLKYINQTSISVLQIPAGVPWEDDELVYLVIGIAATMDEHIGILQNLANVVDDIDSVRFLSNTTKKSDIINSLDA